MLMESLGIGFIVSIVFFEVFNILPGGMIVPGYIALYIEHPMRIVTTLFIAYLTYIIVKFLYRFLIIYGHRKFAAMIVVGFFLKWLIEISTGTFSGFGMIESIGYVIPGLIANAIEVQGFIPTISSVVIASTLVRFVLMIFTKTGF